MSERSDERDALLRELSDTPSFLARALARIPKRELCTRTRAGDFALVEQLWHLSDLEREGYGERIRRILAEHEPALADFDGDRIARERNYAALDAHEGLAMFEAARAANVARLRTATSAELARAATQDQVGRVTLSDVARMMREHDREHRAQIECLLGELAGA